MSRRRVPGSLLALPLAFVLALTSLVLLPATPARAAGHAGVCTDDSGVTVVVDFQQLGGGTVVRCADDFAGGTGLDALRQAGFSHEGVKRWGDAFICRLEGKPAAGTSIAVQGDGGYRERCIDTPPATAYWSYWHATDGGSWTYSQKGVTNRQAVRGGFEGWSFSLNADSSANPRPRFTPTRPAPVEEPGTAPTEDRQQNREPAPDTEETGRDSAGSGSDADRPDRNRSSAEENRTADPVEPDQDGGERRTGSHGTGSAGSDGRAPDGTDDTGGTGGTDPDADDGARDDDRAPDTDTAGSAGSAGSPGASTPARPGAARASSASPSPDRTASPGPGPVLGPEDGTRAAGGQQIAGDAPGTDADRAASSGPPTALLVGLGALALGAIGAGLLAWRRRPS